MTLIRCAILLLLCLLTACAPEGRVVLQSDADGKTGKVVVTTPGGSQLLERPDTVTNVASVGEAPAPARPISKVDIAETWGAVLAVRPTAPRTFLLYFENGTADLTQESRDSLPEIVAAIQGWHLPWVAVVGHADAVGSEEVNDRISLQRAEKVRDLLVEAGVPTAQMELESHGKGDPLIPTPDGIAEPRNRRVSVTIR